MSALIKRIEVEFNEPIRDVLQGFADMGYSFCATAGALEISVRQLQGINRACGVEFARQPVTKSQFEPRRITYQGHTDTVSGWARLLGMPVGTLWGRLYRHGMDVEEAFTRAPHSRRVTGEEAVRRGRS